LHRSDVFFCDLLIAVILMNIASLIHAQNSVVVQLVVFDILMILAGFCGSFSVVFFLCFCTLCSIRLVFCAASISTKVSWRYIWYVISFCYFVAIFSILFHQAKLMDKILGEDFRDIAILYRRLLVLTTVTWSIYPILFVFGPNGSIISGGSITEVTTVLDIFSKGLSGLLLSFAKRSLNKAQDRVAGIEEESSSSCFGLCHEEDNRKKQAPQIDMSQQQMQMLMQMLQLQQQQMMQMPQSPASQYGTPFMPQVNPMTELISPTAQGALPMLPPLPSLPSPTKQFQEPAEPQQQQPEQPQQQQQQQQQQMHSVPQVRVLQPQIPSPDLKSSTPTSVADGVLSPASENKRQTSLVICVSAPTDKPPLGRVRSGSFSFQQESRAESQSRVIAMEITDPSHPPDQQEAARLAADADARRLADQQKAVEQKRQADQKAELEAKRLAEQRLAEQRETQRRMAQLAEEQQRAELAQKQRQEELKRQEEQKRQEEIRRQAEVQAVAEAQARRLMEQKLAEQKAAEKAAAEKAAAEKAAAEQAAAEKAAAEKAIAERLAQQRAAEADAKRFADETAAMLQRSTAAKIAEASKVQQEQAFQQQMQMQQMQMQPQMAVDPMQAMQQQFNALAAAKLGASSPPSNYADSPKTSMSMPMINQSPKTNIIPQSPRSSSMSTLTAAPVSAEFQKLSPAVP
jgi:colicin import membrane protein